MSNPLTIFISLLLAASTASASPLAAVRASSQLEAQKNFDKYHPMLLLDGNSETIWCSSAGESAQGQQLTFMFKAPQKIDAVTITLAAQSPQTIRKVRLFDGTRAVEMTLDDEPLNVGLNSPLEGNLFVLSIEKTVAGNSTLPKGSACIAEVQLSFRNKPWGGAPLSRKLLRINRHADKIIGQWAGGSFGAPDKHLLFALDGTWSWQLRPLLGGGRPQRHSGEYRFRGNRLLMRKGEVGRWADVNLKHRREKVDINAAGAPRGNYDVLVLNSALMELIADEYNNAEF